MMELGTLLFKKSCSQDTAVLKPQLLVLQKVLVTAGNLRSVVNATSCRCDPCSQAGFISTAYSIFPWKPQERNGILLYSRALLMLERPDLERVCNTCTYTPAHCSHASVAVLRERLEAGKTLCPFKWGI